MVTNERGSLLYMPILTDAACADVEEDDVEDEAGDDDGTEHKTKRKVRGAGVLACM